MREIRRYNGHKINALIGGQLVLSLGRNKASPDASAISGLILSAPQVTSMSPSIFAASLWMAPMNASLPPPTIPMRSFLFILKGVFKLKIT